MTRPNILAMLHNDHRKVEQLFNDLERTTTRDPGRRKSVFSEIDESLGMHADFEEQHVYPLLESSKAAKSIMLEALEEHLQLKRLLTELRELDPQDERWMAKAQVLMEDVRHHMQEEEEEAFPQLRSDAGVDTLQLLAEGYQALLDQAQLPGPAVASSKPSVQTSNPQSDSSNTQPQRAKQRLPQARSKKAKDSRKNKAVARLLRDEGE